MPHPEPERAALPAAVQQRLDALEAQVRDLQVNEQRSVTLFSEAPNPAFLLNSQGRIENANAAACGLLGRAPEGLLGKRLDQFLSPGSQGSFDTLLRQVTNTALKQRGEAQLPHSNGAASHLLLDVALVQQDGAFLHLHVAATDITTHSEAHQGLLDGEATQALQIQHQAAIVRSLSQELEQTTALFIQQLHPPVARAMNFLGVLRRTLGGAPQEVTSPLLNAEQALQQIVFLMASIGRYMQSRHMRTHLQQVDLGRVVREVLKNAQPLMADRNVQITHDALPTVQGDSQALYILLDEYVSNALKFTRGREQARIHVVVREMDGEHHIGVEDNGAGFNMRAKDKVF